MPRESYRDFQLRMGHTRSSCSRSEWTIAAPLNMIRLLGNGTYSSPDTHGTLLVAGILAQPLLAVNKNRLLAAIW